MTETDDAIREAEKELHELGELAYRAYIEAAGFTEFPRFAQLPENSRRAWAAAGLAVANHTTAVLTEVFDGFGVVMPPEMAKALWKVKAAKRGRSR